MSRRIFIFAGFLVAGLLVSANDTIRFIWKSGLNKPLSIYNGASFTVNWGDNSNTNIMGIYVWQNINHTYADTNDYEVSIIANTGGLWQFNCSYNTLSRLDLNCPILTYLHCHGNQLNNLNLNNNTALWYLECQNNLLTNLNLSNITALQNLYCNNNQLDTLDLTNNKSLQYLECHNNNISSLIIPTGVTLQRLYCQNNQLLLSDLYALQPRVQLQMNHPNKRMGPQKLPARQVVVGDTVDFSSQKEFVNYTNIPTVFIVTKDGIAATPAVINVDYTIDSGKIVFLLADTYMLTMYNSAITSDPMYPAMVQVEFVVRAKNTDANLASLAVSKGKLTPVFHTDTLNYFVEVGYSVTDINITATARDTNATVSGHLGLQPLDTGNNVFIINVIAEDNITMQNYFVIVNRKDTVINNITEITKEDIRVYPNPTTGKLKITNYGLRDNTVIEIYDIYGKKHISRFTIHNSHIEIDISHLANGMYFLKVGGKVVKVEKE